MIYKLRADRNNYMNAYISADEIELALGDYFLLDEEQWSGFWKPLNITFSDDSDSGKVNSIPDVTIWGTTSNLVCSVAAKESLEKITSSFGEWLPVLCEGKDYWLFHSTNKLHIDDMDLKKSSRTIDAAGYADASIISLKAGVLDANPLFQTEYNNYKNLYCSDRFKTHLESGALTGLVFASDHSNAP